MEDVLKIISDFKKSHQESKQTFNIFTMLLQKHSEAYLHSSFLSWLLDPKAPHKLGVLPMQLFLEKIGSHHYSEVDTDTTHITPNAINKTEEGDIDILIEDEKQKFAIIIENKIYASDSNTDEEFGQLQKYFYQISKGKLRRNSKDADNRHSYAENQIEVFYLTPDKHKPSHDSTSKSKDLKLEVSDQDVGGRTIKLISYLEHVLPWLKDLLKNEIVLQNSYVREIIAQYMDVVISISCDVDMNKELMEKIFTFNPAQLKQLKEVVQKFGYEKNLEKRYEQIRKEYPTDAEDAEAVDFILNNIKHVYWHSLDDLFQKLQKALTVYVIPRPDRALSEVLTDIVHKGKRPKDLYLEIRGGWRFQFNEHKEQDFPKGFFLAKYDKNDKGEWAKWSVKPKYVNDFSKFNLWDFTKGDTFDLLNKEKRQEIAKRYAAFVKQELNKL